MLPSAATKSIPVRWIQLTIEVVQLLIELQCLDSIDEYPLEQIF